MNKKIISLILFAFVLQSACEDEPTLPKEPSYGSIGGIVKDQITDKPLVGVRVEALLNQVVDTTDSLGEFFLDSLIVGEENINISAQFFEN